MRSFNLLHANRPAPVEFAISREATVFDRLLGREGAQLACWQPKWSREGLRTLNRMRTEWYNLSLPEAIWRPESRYVVDGYTSQLKCSLNWDNPSPRFQQLVETIVPSGPGYAEVSDRLSQFSATYAGLTRSTELKFYHYCETQTEVDPDDEDRNMGHTDDGTRDILQAIFPIGPGSMAKDSTGSWWALPWNSLSMWRTEAVPRPLVHDWPWLKKTLPRAVFFVHKLAGPSAAKRFA